MAVKPMCCCILWRLPHCWLGHRHDAKDNWSCPTKCAYLENCFQRQPVRHVTVVPALLQSADREWDVQHHHITIDQEHMEFGSYFTFYLIWHMTWNENGSLKFKLDDQPSTYALYMHCIPGMHFHFSGWVWKKYSVKCISYVILIFGNGANIYFNLPKC